MSTEFGFWIDKLHIYDFLIIGVHCLYEKSKMTY